MSTTPEDTTKCRARTKKGTRCTYNHLEGSEFCTMHLENQPYGVIDDDDGDGGVASAKRRSHKTYPEEAADNELLARAEELLRPSAPPPGWKIDDATKKKEGDSKVSYLAHNGVRVTVSTTDYLKMLNGVLRVKRPPVSEVMVGEAVELLAQLSFFTCGICGKPVGSDGGRLKRMCYAVVRDSKRRLPSNRSEAKSRPKDEKLVTLPGAHTLCMKVEGGLTDIVIARDSADNDTLRDQLKEIIEKVWGEVCEEGIEFSRADVIDAVQNVYIASTQGGE